MFIRPIIIFCALSFSLATMASPAKLGDKTWSTEVSSIEQQYVYSLLSSWEFLLELDSLQDQIAQPVQIQSIHVFSEPSDLADKPLPQQIILELKSCQKYATPCPSIGFMIVDIQSPDAEEPYIFSYKKKLSL